VQGVMWALCIVLAAAALDACLRGLLVGRWWPSGVGLAGAVPALVPPVLLWAPRCKTLMTDAERDPPHGELAQAAEGRGGAWRAVVRTTGVRQAILPEPARADGACVRWLRREPR
jgi:hypothetical protein